MLRSCRLSACCRSSSRHQSSDSKAAPAAAKTPLIFHVLPSNDSVLPGTRLFFGDAEASLPPDDRSGSRPAPASCLRRSQRDCEPGRHRGVTPRTSPIAGGDCRRRSRTCVPEIKLGGRVLLAVSLSDALDAARQQVGRPHGNRRVFQVLAHAEREHDRGLRIAADRQRPIQSAHEPQHDQHEQVSPSTARPASGHCAADGAADCEFHIPREGVETWPRRPIGVQNAMDLRRRRSFASAIRSTLRRRLRKNGAIARLRHQPRVGDQHSQLQQAMRSPSPDPSPSARDRVANVMRLPCVTEAATGSVITQACNCSSSPFDSELARAPLQMQPPESEPAGDSGAGRSSCSATLVGEQQPCGQAFTVPAAVAASAQQPHPPPALHK